MKKQSLTKNFIFQFAYQSLIMILPLILSPYLTRTLQENSLGVYSFVNSIAYYFFVFANLGISKHGQRIISQNCNDQIKLRKTFWSLFTLHIIVSLFSILVYTGFIFLFVGENRDIYFYHILYLASAMFDLTWLFYGLENFKSAVIRNTVVKLIEFVLIILFVKSPSDLGIYTIIVNGGLLAGSVVLIPIAVKTLKPIYFSRKDLLQHIKPMLVFSVSVIAVSLYTIFDKTLLGLFADKADVAYYEYAYRIDRIPIVIASVIGTVMFPRACRMASQGDVQGQKKYFRYSIFMITAICMGSMFGVLAISDLLAIEYYGVNFSICGEIMKALCPLIYIVSVGEIIRTQYLIPNGMDKEYVKCLLINAAINLCLSSLLIPFLGIYGAVIGTIAAELFGLIYQSYKCKQLIKIRDFIKPLIPFLLISIFMYFAIKGISFLTSSDLRGLVIQVISGIAIFSILTTAYLFIFERQMFKFLFKKFLKRKNNP